MKLDIRLKLSKMSVILFGGFYMWYKQSNLNKAIGLIEQKKSLQRRLTLAIQNKRTFSARLLQIQLTLVNQKWRNTAIKLSAGNDTEY